MASRRERLRAVKEVLVVSDRSGSPTAVAVSGSPSRTSKSAQLVSHAARRLTGAGVPATVVDLAALPADDLLGRTKTDAIAGALAAVQRADVLVVGTPVYRASYSGLLKVFFDLLPQDALARTVAVVVATGGGPGHLLVLDYALRPLLQSVGALVVATGVYGTDGQFGAEGPHPALLERLDAAVDDALGIARAWPPPSSSRS